jgi:shikimate kinase
MDQGSHRRDLPNDELKNMLARREPLLADLADIVIDASKTPAEIVDELVPAIAEAAEHDRIENGYRYDSRGG